MQILENASPPLVKDNIPKTGVCIKKTLTCFFVIGRNKVHEVFLLPTS